MRLTKIFYIYKITCLVNNKIYIGQTQKTIQTRFKRHINDALSGRLNTKLANAIRKYGKDNFSICEIDTADTKNELDQKEIKYIKKYNSISNGYNQTIGGDGGNTYQFKSQEEMNEISSKIATKCIGGLNSMARKIKCKNIITNQELFFDSFTECKAHFGEKSDNFAKRRCAEVTKYVYKNEWLFAYIENEYITDFSTTKNIKRKKKILVKNIKTNEEYMFESYRSAEEHFKLPNKYLSGHANRHKNKKVWTKGDFQITFIE